MGTKGREYAARIGKMVRNVEEGCSMEGGPAGGAEGDQAGVSLGFLLSFLRISGKGFKTCEEGADQFTFLPCPQDALKLLRIRTTKHELIITPGELRLPSASFLLTSQDQSTHAFLYHLRRSQLRSGSATGSWAVRRDAEEAGGKKGERGGAREGGDLGDGMKRL